jgi:hypothetical protein
MMGKVVAALYVQEDGCYNGLDDVDMWTERRDARLYAGPFPVVAHPPCKRWGRYWHGSPRSPHSYVLGDDGGCFTFALRAVRRFGGVIEHPAASKAWAFHGLNAPPHDGGWVFADNHDGFTCQVSQGWYGHNAPKATWLYVNGTDLPDLRWGKSYATGRIDGLKGGNKYRLREATPIPFRDLLLEIARTAL